MDISFNKLILGFLFPFALHAIPTNNVDAEVQWDTIYAETPYTVTLSVTHDAQDPVDPATFTADHKKINPTFVKTVQIEPHSSPLQISIYQVEMAGLPQGLQILPTFRVKIGDKIVASSPVGFEVKGKNKAASTTSPQTQSKGAPTLKLQAVFTGTEPLYPGQRFFLGYRYLYSGNIDLAEESLPLLEAKDFKKIGDKRIDDFIEKEMSVTQAVQQFEADLAGEFTYPPSKIVGYAYTLNAAGQKQYNKTPLSSSLPAFSIKVVAFPEQNKPASFRGATGSYTIHGELKGSNQIEAGDRIQILLSISGTGELEQLLPPDLCCQPGFSGYFKPSDLPPKTAIEGNTKTFLIDLYVENPDTEAIPPIEFSFFNPTNHSYQKVTTEKIPLKVTAKKPIALTPQEPIQKAPVEEKNSFLRESAVNDSIKELLKAPSSFKNNVLIAESLLQLRQYSFALFYLLEALHQKPSDQTVRDLMQETISLGGLSASVPPLSFFGPAQSLIAAALVFTLLSVAAWAKKKNKFSLILSLFSFSALLYLLILSYRSPILAVTIQAHLLFQQPSSSLEVSSSPLASGMIVTVLDVVENGSWIKVRTPSGLMGYLPQKSLRIVD